MKKIINLLIPLLIILGIFDASYLVHEHYSGIIPPCSINNIFVDCGKVLRSEYSVIFGIPLALLGLVYYTTLLSMFLAYRKVKNILLLQFTFFVSCFGMLFSFYLMYLQFFIIHSICLYCTFSAILSFSIFVILVFDHSKEFCLIKLLILSALYRYILRRILFLFDSELIHNFFARFGEVLGIIFYPFIRTKKNKVFKYSDIPFTSRIGLAAGFDYEARLTKITPLLGFGFHTVGTITNIPCVGNPKPRLGRLIKSQSLLVNKGFKNPGADEIIKKMKDHIFKIPIGISIGKSNVQEINTQEKSVKDIVSCFKKFEDSSVGHSYYELNISCPNLSGNVSFYSKDKLVPLLESLQKIKIRKPVFVKMPISEKDTVFKEIINTLSKYKFIRGVIIGNLQKNRDDQSLDKGELKKWKLGSFSGRPTYKRSNELIKLTKTLYKNRFIIIGCGGIFTVFDAKEKIKMGADLVQMITGMIFEGPFRVKEISLLLD